MPTPPEHVEVVVVPRSFDRSGGSITGPIWLRHGARGARPADFPEAGWTDFPVLILGWWLDALGALARGDVGEATCLFMDGPFEVTATDAGRTLWRVRCVGRYLDAEEPVAEFTAPGVPLLESAVAAAAAALAECDRRGWTGRDVDELRRAVGAAGPA